jgi:iron(III) transport system ATP-binding protein
MRFCWVSRLAPRCPLPFPARIAKAIYVGSRVEYTVEAKFGTLFAVLDDVTDPLAPGSDIMLSFARSGPVLVPE